MRFCSVTMESRTCSLCPLQSITLVCKTLHYQLPSCAWIYQFLQFLALDNCRALFPQIKLLSWLTYVHSQQGEEHSISMFLITILAGIIERSGEYNQILSLLSHWTYSRAHLLITARLEASFWLSFTVLQSLCNHADEDIIRFIYCTNMFVMT